MAAAQVHVMAVAPFFDREAGTDRRPGEEFDVTEARLAQLNACGTEQGGVPLVSVLAKEPHSPEGKKADAGKRVKRQTKAELTAEAEKLGVEVPEGATASALAKLVAEAKLGKED